MRYILKHGIRGRIRVRALNPLTDREADMLQYHLEKHDCVNQVHINEISNDIVIKFSGPPDDILEILDNADTCIPDVPEDYLSSSPRKLNREFREKLITHVALRGIQTIFLPSAVKNIVIAAKSLKYIKAGIRTLMKGKLEVPVLDGTAIGVSVIRNDFRTAGSIMFLLTTGEILEQWTEKKTIADLARSMASETENVWIEENGTERQVNICEISPGQIIRVRTGSMIPVEGKVIEGIAMVNQSSLTGEPLPVEKKEGSSVYAGTFIAEGEIRIRVETSHENSRFEKIMNMIEDTQRLKSSAESRAHHMADRLVPYTFAGTLLTWLITGNLTKALTVLMVDYSCALKLALPISVLSAIRECRRNKITVKGGRYLEALANADTIVFDKTGTLTAACPKVAGIIPFCDMSPDELLRTAACLEEHFPHSVARAVVNAAIEKGLDHEEMHTDIQYQVAHGISSDISGNKVILGSYHFVFEDEKCTISEEYAEVFSSLDRNLSHLYMAENGILTAVIYIEDPVRSEAAELIASLRSTGISDIVMLTGDSENAARTVAETTGIDEFHYEVFPEDKASFIEEKKKNGHCTIMVGDGINDSPAMSVSDVSVAVCDGAGIAREVADITVEDNNLNTLLTLREISEKLEKRNRSNFHQIIGFNTLLLLLGAGGMLSPASAALLHNISTVAISIRSMGNLLK